MTQPKTPREYINAVGERDEIMIKYLKLDAWTSTMAALLANGIQAPLGCNQVPDGGVDFNNNQLHASSIPFHEARRILRIWDEWNSQSEQDDQDDQDGALLEIHPIDFFNWCIDENIETRWNKLFLYLAGYRFKDYVDALPSALSLLVPTPISQTNKTDDAKNGFPTRRIKTYSGPMGGIIRSAQGTAFDPECHHSVWGEIEKLASRPVPSSPIIGFVDGKVKYRTETGPKFFTKKALYKRMNLSAR